MENYTTKTPRGGEPSAYLVASSTGGAARSLLFFTAYLNGLGVSAHA